jgi:hypothetical protein
MTFAGEFWRWASGGGMTSGVGAEWFDGSLRPEAELVIEPGPIFGPGSCRTGLKEPSAAPGSPTRGTPRARRHTKRAGLGTPRAKRRRKRARPGTRGSHAPPKKSRARLKKTRPRDSASQAPVEKSRVWDWGVAGGSFFVRCEGHLCGSRWAARHRGAQVVGTPNEKSLLLLASAITAPMMSRRGRLRGRRLRGRR